MAPTGRFGAGRSLRLSFPTTGALRAKGIGRAANMNASLVVFLVAGLGGVLRHLINAWITRLVGPDFPVGILAINVIGSSTMGFLAGWFAFQGHGHTNCASS